MRMHDPSLGDPVIEQPEPVTLFLPILEASLRRAGLKPGRDEMVRRFMSGEPRVVIVAGARDHPAQIDDDDVSRRAVAAIWAQGALPFETLAAEADRAYPENDANASQQPSMASSCHVSVPCSLWSCQ